MAETLLRVGLIALVVAMAGLVGYLARRRPSHPAIDVTGAGFDPGLVVFTSTNCRRCTDVLAAAKATGVPLREVTYEIEAALQERLGVNGVPLTLVINDAGEAVGQFAGLVTESRLRRGLRRAGF